MRQEEQRPPTRTERLTLWVLQLGGLYLVLKAVFPGIPWPF